MEAVSLKNTYVQRQRSRGKAGEHSEVTASMETERRTRALMTLREDSRLY